MQSEIEFQKLTYLVEKVGMIMQGINVPSDPRSKLSIGCLHSATEHQASITLLYSMQMYGSAFSLLRVLFESTIRGMWLSRAASEEDLKRFINGVKKEFGDLVKEVEATAPDLNGSLTALKNLHWNAMNGFTHTGIHQVSRRHGATALGAFYAESDLMKLLKATSVLGILAYGEIIELSQSPEVLAKVKKTINEIDQWAIDKAAATQPKHTSDK
ncbi:DUF6988 family protein [Herbaspirillum chlorophenolicum]|uniref:DUF6988 family protein n=1 Tax=Herbaspirillum chlorophenolicum TaxID=211589 RepID=UPI00067C9C51|nr:DUF5677 domain-containing protein [Herbaspirillum chlorophenolicum]